MSKFLLPLLFISCILTTNLHAQNHIISSSTPLKTSIVLDQNSNINIRSSYNVDTLTIRFNSKQNNQGISFVPEVLIATNNTEVWNTHWFHSSYENCYDNGSYYTWEDCNSHLVEWSVEQNESGRVAISISWKKLNSTPEPGREPSLSLKLSTPETPLNYWSKKADISTLNT
ncbi:MAG: hypothetical protein COB81_10815 [Flavobacteriaceae bacterium]|nr:MAG: hypothetical protein COB81_10815 [Flavobacteriaceae bacterium]